MNNLCTEILNYDLIRPYNDQEARSAFLRIADDEHIRDIVEYLSPETDIKDFKCMISSGKGVEDFQRNVMYYMVKAIINKTTSGMTYSGISNVKDGHKHLLLSNHRDIILDPAIMQIIFFDNDVPTTEIAVGDNLITSQFIEDIARSNRMVKVLRGGTPREKYSHSLLLSNYMRMKIASDSCSIWIAQRNGRAKNGLDVTEQGLLKMLDISGKGNFVDNFMELCIVPVSISYQFEPCDFLKARELYISRRETYIKKEGEDLFSILTGVKQFKGGICCNFNQPVSIEDVEICSKYDKNDKFKSLAGIIDSKIRSSYKLWNNNYIASDLLSGDDKYADEKYSKEDRGIFIEYMENGLSRIVEKDRFIDIAELRELFLSIYSNPVA